MKQIKLLALSMMLCIVLCACGGGGSDSGASGNNTNGGGTGENNTQLQEDTEEVVVDNTPVIAIGETQVIDSVCEFFVDYTDIATKITPPTPGSYYSYYEADDGKVYVDVCVSYKNLATSDVDADETMDGILIYGGKYEYTGFSIIEEDNRSDFTYSNITSIAPLSTEYVHYLFQVPEEVSTSGASVEVKLNIGGNDYKIIVTEGNGETISGNNDLGKTSGEVAIGEVVVTKEGEFNVDYANIEKRIDPPTPGSFYSYYEADDGKVYVDICFAYKNTSSENADADEVVSAKLKYAGKYDYTGFSIIEEDNRSDFTYSNITSIAPLTTEYVHYLFEVPEEVASSTESVVITFTIGGNTYTYTVR